jgi:hypothetical protein
LIAALIALSVLATLGAGQARAGAPPARPFHSCGSVGSSAGSGYGEIRAYGLHCHAARRVISRALNHGTPAGWTFFYNGDGPDEYRKGRKRITGIPLGDRPWRDARAASMPHLIGNERSLFEPPEYCPSNHTCFSNAEWRLWGRKRAVAIAIGETSYPPNSPVSEEIKFIFNVPKHVCGGYYYTRARWRYAGDGEFTMSFLLPPTCIWTGA